ncbi:uncharacterized protein LOC142235421 [Haematobia irritans]|uniref:uncharacterized protein LOC142235421 n=1 Tax=Haematobia irritans TaxID=7368 RepID=UPI003F50BB3F
MENEIGFPQFATSGRQMWFEAPTKLLLAKLEELLPNVGKTFYLKSKRRLWQVIAEHLEQHGYQFTPDQVEIKFRALERQFKKVKLNNSLTGRNKQQCPYQLELESILGNKKCIKPDFVLDSESIIESPERDLFAADNSSDLDEDVTTHSKNEKSLQDESKPKKGKKGRSSAIKILEEMAEERKTYHSSVLKILEAKEKRSQRKMELLEKIACSINN